MKPHAPLVIIGIPTYNRAAMLRRAIESALGQDYPAIEVIISDNASTDETQDICQEFTKKDDRVTYIRQAANIGAVANFSEVLKRATCEYFMWLGDDDWVDPIYISHCVSVLIDDPDMALVSGVPAYYRSGDGCHHGRVFDLVEKSWAVRVAKYYSMVTDNGMFYGVMRSGQLREIDFLNTMGGDWHLIAYIVSTGKSKMLSSVIVHRELGGATASYQKIAESMGLSKIQAVFPMLTIAAGAWLSVVSSGAAYKRRSLSERVLLASVIFLMIVARSMRGYFGGAKRLFARVALAINKLATLRMDRRP